MIPIKLTIEGLYSYQKKQVIEFEKLTSAKLFGIFGAVGSGKTTILEAISLALYGECEKLNKRNSFAYNLMNLKKDTLYIEYEFKTFSGEYYKFTVQAKRKKSFSDVSNLKRSAYQKLQNEWQPIKTTSATELLGLSYEYFKRTTIVPQGKFQEFLQLGAKDRITMLKDIFSLQRFDLYDKAANLDKFNKTKIDQIQGQLKHLDEISSDYIDEKKKVLSEQKQSLVDTSNQLQKQQNALQKQQVLHELFLEIHNQEQLLQGLLSKMSQYQQLEQKVTQYEVCYKQFSVLLSQYDDKQQALTQIKQQLENQQKNLQNLEFQSNQAQSIINQNQLDIEQLQKKRDELQKKLPEISILSEVKAWLQNQKHLQQQATQYQTQLFSLQQSIDEIEKQKNTITSQHLQQYVQADWQVLDLKGVSLKVDDLISQYESEILQIEQSLNHLSIKAKLEEHAQNLHVGKPCPLCGSMEHPQPLQQTDIKSEVNSHYQQKQNFQQKIKFYRQQQTLLQELITKKTMYQQHLEKNQRYLDDAQKFILEHEQKFIWSDYQHVSEMDIEQQYTDAKRIQQELTKRQKQLDTKLKDLDAIKVQFSAKQNELSQLRGEIGGLQTYMKDFQVQLQNVDKQLLQALQKTDYQTIEQIKMILAEDVAIDTERSKINQFNQNLYLIQQHLQTLQAKTQGQQFDKTQFELLKQTVDELLKTVETHKRLIITLEHSIQQLQKDLHKKQQLQTELDELERRAQNIELLKKLFQGSGFVNYVSTVFLQDLVNAANERFIRLTQQKLRLELNDKNEFEVRDFMNDGQLRSVKTLSGGQIFQASLSLALALSDSIQKTTKTTQNFFFLDEGFGSQDKESLQLVFETLKSLRHENKIVGIISHVDDLKQELDFYLIVKNTEKQGSLVEYYWG